LPTPEIQNTEEFKSEFIKLYALYERVKPIGLYAEVVSGKVILDSINEYRYAFDHLMRSISGETDMFSMFRKAQDHLYRAGYDAYEIISLIKLESIKGCLASHSPQIISQVCPAYYPEYHGKIKKIERDLTTARTHKTDVDQGTHEFDLYEASIQELIQIEETLMTLVPEFNRAKKWHNKNMIKVPAAIVIFGCLFAFFLNYIFPNFALKPAQGKQSINAEKANSPVKDSIKNKQK